MRDRLIELINGGYEFNSLVKNVMFVKQFLSNTTRYPQLYKLTF